jgi:hypothetical protein
MLGCTLAAATTIHVPGDSSTIQGGIDLAHNGDTVMVEPGTYTENINFNGKNITVTSSAGPLTTIIQSAKSGKPVVGFLGTETSNAALRGFTVQNGIAPYGSSFAGGVDLGDATATISHNIIQNNQGCFRGHGVRAEGAARIYRNVIQNNGMSDFYCQGYIGGGLYIGKGTKVIGNWILGNSLEGAGGGIGSLTSSDAVISNNIIRGNSTAQNITEGRGGGICLEGDSGTLISQNLIAGNTASGGSGISISSGTPSTRGTSILNNTILAGAPTDQFGFTVYLQVYGPPAHMLNNIVVGRPGGYGIVCDTAGHLMDIKNNDGYASGGTGISCAGGVANISADPLFVSGSNFELQAGSPVIDSGLDIPGLPSLDLAGNPRLVGSSVDMGAYEYQGGAVPETLH